MAKTMTPSATFTPITNGQINKAVANYRALLEKHREEFASEPTQQALGSPSFHGDMLGLIRRHVEKFSEVIVRHFKVDRTKTPRKLIDASGRVQYVDQNVLATMPTDGPEEGDLVFFPVKSFSDFRDVPALFESRVLIPDPAAQAQVNVDDLAFADEHPNGVQWGLEGNVASFASWDRWGARRRVDVGRGGSRWSDYAWLAGRRKISNQT